ncbi:hypothetical protein Tco_0413259 [Tanacetum coccineum]
MALGLSAGVKEMILAAQSEAFKRENVLTERLPGLDQQMEIKGDESLYFMDRIWVLLVGSLMDEAHCIRYWSSDERISRTYKPWRHVKAAISKTFGLLQQLRYLSENEIESPWILSLNFQGCPFCRLRLGKAQAVRVLGWRSCVIKGVALERRDSFWKESYLTCFKFNSMYWMDANEHVPLERIKVVNDVVTQLKVFDEFPRRRAMFMKLDVYFA